MNLKVKVLGILGVLFLFSGCAATRPGVTGAAKAPGKSKPQKTRDQELAEMRAKLQLECPKGGDGGVDIAYRLTEWGGLFNRRYVMMRVFNPYPAPIDIFDERGVVVKNLCSLGSITLFRRLNTFIGDSNQLDVFWTARGLDEHGRVGFEQSRRVSLNVWDTWRTQQIEVWQVRLQPQNQIF